MRSNIPGKAARYVGTAASVSAVLLSSLAPTLSSVAFAAPSDIAGTVHSLQTADPTLPTLPSGASPKGTVGSILSKIFWGSGTEDGRIRPEYLDESDPEWNTASGNYWTKTQLQTSGQSIVDWGNVANKPAWMGTGGSSFSTGETDPVWSAASGNYYNKTELQGNGSANVHWNNLKNLVPATGSATGVLVPADWTNFNNKQNQITGAASSVTGTNLATNRAVISDGAGKIAVSGVTATELSFLSGATSNIQAQLAGKLGTGTNLDPTTGANTTNYVPKWNGSQFVSSNISDTGTGNIGIGIANAGYKLQVTGTAHFSRDGEPECCSTSNTTLSLAENTDTTGKVATIQFHNSGVSEGYFRLANGWARRFQIGDNQGVTMGVQMSGNLQVDGTGNSYIAGSVGIGTSAPTSKLDVVGGIVGDYLQLRPQNGFTGLEGWEMALLNSDVETNRNGRVVLDNYDQGLRIFRWKSNPDEYTEYAVFQPAKTYLGMQGKVGIGTSTPVAQLDVSNTDASAPYFKAGYLSVDSAQGYGLVNLVAGAKFAGSGTGHTYMDTRGASRIEMHDGFLGFFVGGTTGTAWAIVPWTETMYMDAASIRLGMGSQAVGVGTATPSEKLEVKGNIALSLSGGLPEYRLKNVASPIANYDAANKAYVDAKVAAGGGGGGTAAQSPYLEDGSYYSEGGDPYFCRLNILSGTSQRIVSVNQNKLCDTANNLYCNAGNCNASSTILNDIKQNYQLITAKDDQSCSINDGQVYCWGYTGNGQKYLSASMSPNDGSGYGHTCVVNENGTVKCWGSGTNGELGNGGSSNSNTPVAVQGITNAVRVYTSQALYGGQLGLSCALLSDQTVKCWGYLPTIGATYTPALLNVTGVVDFSMSDINTSGEGHWCAALSNGTVKCSGTGNYGQLGNGAVSNTNWTSGAVLVTGISNAVRVFAASSGYSTNYGYSCALLSTGDIHCWGAAGPGGRIGQGIVWGYRLSTFTGGSIASSAVSATGMSLSSNNGSQGHNCYVGTNGTVWCWGYNGYGQLGNNSTADSGVPVQASGITNAVKVYTASSGYSTAYGRSCALLSDQTVKCWGYLPSYGQSNTPIAITGLTGVTDFAMSADNASQQGHWCAITGGTVKCSGTNNYGQLGNGNTTSYSWISPQSVGGITNASKIYVTSSEYSTTYAVSCAVLSDGNVKCWGSDAGGYGLLGNATYVGTNTSTPALVMPTITATGVAISPTGSSSYGHGCKVATNWTVWCWGYNAYWQLGDGTTTTRYVPVQVSGITNAVKIWVTSSGYSTNYGRSCALLSDQTVKCWWYLPSYGQTNTPIAITGLTGVTDFAMSMENSSAEGHWCAVLSTGSVKCAGTGNYGQLGNGGASAANWISGAVTVSWITNASKIYVSSSGYTTNYGMSCAILTNGKVKCWGYNGYGQLGDGTTTTRYAPVWQAGIWYATGASLSQNGSAYGHSCEVETDGTVKCWGYNAYWQLGDGTTTTRYVPVQVSDITNAVKVYTSISAYSTDYGYSCALLSDQTVKCWGYLSSYGSTSTPIAISGLTGVTDFAISNNNTSPQSHWCAVTGWTVKCAGAGDYGQLGNGGSSATNWVSGAVTVSGISNAVKIYVASSAYSTSYGHSCALLSDQTVKCWGYLPSYGTTYTPLTITGLTGVTDFSMTQGNGWAQDHWCAVSAGAVKCSWFGSYGQLGNNSTTSYSWITPQSVSGITNASKIYTSGAWYTTSYARSCALLSDQTVKCWGYLPSYGQTNVPIAITGLTGVTEFSMSMDNSSQQGHWCAISSGTIKCSGTNTYGQLGNGNSTSYSWIAPQNVSGIAGTPVKVFTSISWYTTDYGRSCAITSDGNMFCWGYNGNGQLGDESTTTRYSAVGLNRMPVWVQNMSISPVNGNQATAHACAVQASGYVKCWGYNNQWELGNNSTTNANYPVNVAVINNAVKVYTDRPSYTTDYGRTCALLSDQTVKCWGYLPSYGSTSSPLAISGLSGVTDFAMSNGNSSGQWHWCAASSGMVKCSGTNDYGQLGNGNTSAYNWLSAQSAAGGITDAVKVAVGSSGYNTTYGYSCALRSNGQVSCWGYNGAGHLGDGTATQRYSPSEQPVGVQGVTDLSISEQNNSAYAHICARESSGKIKCWGYGGYWQVGNGMASGTNYPSEVSGITNASKIYTASSGYSTPYGRSCALLSDQTVKCWGYLPSYGQASTPVAISGLTGVTDFSMSSDNGGQLGHWCAVLSSGTVKCAGTNNYGQLGNETNSSTNWVSGAVTVSGISNATQVLASSAGYSTDYGYSCARLTTGDIRCWGYAGTGRIGGNIFNGYKHSAYGFAGGIDVSPMNATQVSLSQSDSSGNGHACAVLANGGMECWGSNGYGELGDWSTTNRAIPVAVSGVSNALKAYTAGTVYSTHYGRTCTLLQNGQIKCWGYLPSYGQANTPQTITGISTAVDFSMSSDSSATGHWCAVLADGTIKCAGYGANGQLGNNATSSTNWLTSPVIVSNISNAVKVLTGDSGYSPVGSSCAILANGQIKCWGYNYYGRLGDGAGNGQAQVPQLVYSANGIYYNGIGAVTVDRTIPELKEGITAATSVSAGSFHACAIEGGAVRCWGYNAEGQLGNNSSNNSTVPVGVFGISTAKQLATGYMHSCAILNDNTVKCWGLNSYGQLGNGSTTSSTTPVAVTGITNAVWISAGDNHTCVTLSDGTVKCWGLNDKGQLGNGSGISSTTPVVATGVSGASRITAGNEHTCISTTGGAVWCWGANDYGQVGTGIYSNTVLTPVQVSGITTADRVGGGGKHTCATLTDNTLRCWGLNATSQQASTSYFATPTVANLLGTQNILTVVGGGVHSCVISTDLGNLNCFWGNYHGQLGIGNTNNTANVALVTYPVNNSSDVTTYTIALCETKDSYNGNLGGAEGANAICQTQCGQGYKMARASELANFSPTAISPSTYWMDTPQSSNCSNWTDGATGNGNILQFLSYNSTYGVMNGLSYTSAACSSSRQLLCVRGVR